MLLGGFQTRSFITISVIATGLLGALAAVAPAGQASTTPTIPAARVALAASAAPALPSGAVRLGALAADTPLTLEVTLNIPDQAALTEFLAGITDPGSPDYGDFLAAGQFGARFGPTLAQVAAVDAALRAAGVTPGPAAADRLSIPVTAPAGSIERAFGITLDSYRMPGGRTAFANTAAPEVPAGIAPLVQGVIGLDDLYLAQHLDTAGAPGRSGAGSSPASLAASPAVSAGPQPCAAATGSGAETENYYAAHYGLNALYSVGDYGQGARIAVLELEPDLPGDITAFEQCYGIATRVNYFKVDGGSGSGAGSGEAALDIELAAAFAPKATVDVYQAPNNGAGLYDAVRKFVTSDSDKTLSVSWGSCEAETTAATAKAQETLFEQANAQGQSVFAAAGDSGSTGCYTGNASNTKLSVTSPASSPYVIAVGGTSFTTGVTPQQEIVWNDSGDPLASGAGGGGISTRWCMPAYQDKRSIPGILTRQSVKDPGKSCESGLYREVPDVAAAADPLFGYTVYYDGSWVDFGVGGTSAATPLWASIAALIDVSPFCSAYGSKGPVLPQNLYGAVGAYHAYVYSANNPQVFRDITSGNNDDTASGYTGGRYAATTGFDMASGLGAPMLFGISGKYWNSYLTGLSQLLCRQSATRSKTVKVASVRPSSGKPNRTAKVVVHGTGFMPVAGADEAQIIRGTKVLATVDASCSVSACTVIMPAEPAGTVGIRIFAGSLWHSALTESESDEYKYT